MASPPIDTSHVIGWKDYGCRVGNVAYNKTTWCNGKYAPNLSGKAVDGIIDHPNDQCLQIDTIGTTSVPLWRVDLGRKHTVRRVVIINLSTYPVYDFEVKIGMEPEHTRQQMCARHGSEHVSDISLQCSNDDIQGRYVTIRKTGTPKKIYLCEVIVVGYETIECPRGSCLTICNKITGCSTCKAGKQLPDCVTDCESESYGVNCQDMCGNCASQPCDTTDGSCYGGCLPGYKGKLCKSECDAGSWGPNCEQCGNCKDNEICDRLDGTCANGCSAGYQGEKCADVCDDGKWGEGCGNDCGQCAGDYTCNNTNGVCPAGCNPGYRSIDCTQPCDDSNWGFECAMECGSCVKVPCYHVNGYCNNYLCNNGYKGRRCNEKCDGNTWGFECMSICGQCADDQPCHHVNGNCSNGCEQWYLNLHCDDYINTPTIAQSLEVIASSSSEIQVMWSKTNNVKPGLEKYYMYKILFSTDSTTQSRERNHITTTDTYSIILSGLSYNTEYSIQVIPYRVQNGKRDDGEPTAVVTGKTLCTSPSKPVLTVTSIFGGWQILFSKSTNIEIGCDNITFYSLNVASSKGELVLYSENILGKTTIDLNFRAEFNGTFMWLEIINNGGYATNSSTQPLIHIIIESTTSIPTNDSLKFADNHKRKNSQVGGIVGGVVAILVVAAVAVGVVLFIRRNTIFKKTESSNNNRRTFSILPMKYRKSKLDYENEYETIADPKFPTTGIPVTQIGDYIKTKDNNPTAVEKEYFSIKLASSTATIEKANQSENRPKNRYKNIKAYDHSRVVLDCNRSDQDCDYINACFIPGYHGDERKYIAGQGPVPHTITDTWRMIWQYDITRIVMATNLNEMGKRKCERYWPEKVGETCVYGDITVKLTAVEDYADYQIRHLVCSKSEDNFKTVVQFHFTSWPDKEVLDTAFPLLMFRHKVNSYNDSSLGPLFVHCSAGIGRTGTYIAIDYLIDQGLAEGKIDVHQCVTFLREHRMNMVQTTEQYKFIHEVLHDAFIFGDTNIPCSDVIQTVKDNHYSEDIQKQYKAIITWNSPKSTVDKKYDGHLQENVHKNRENTPVPCDSFRPYLQTQWSSGNDYINAVYVNSYRRQKAFIVTQYPLPNTVVDFWRLVFDHRCENVVMLGSAELDQQHDELYANYECNTTHGYWPAPECTKAYGPTNVTLDNEELSDGFVFREITVDHKDESFLVKHIQMTHWLDFELPDVKSFLKLVTILDTAIEDQRQSPILIQCCNGTAKSGLLLAAMLMVERMKIDQEVDVVNAVRSVKTFRQQLINNQEQFQFLYTVASSYQDMFSIYENTM